LFQKCLVKKDLRATPKLATNLRNRQYHFEAYRSTVSCWRPESGRGQGRVRRGRPRRGMRRRYDLGATLGGDEDQQRLRRRHRHRRRRRRLRRRLRCLRLRLRCLRLRATLVLALALAPDEQLAKDTKPLSATCCSFLSCTSHAPFRPLCMASQILTSLGIPTTLPCRCAAPHGLPAPWRRRRSSFSTTRGRGSWSRTTVALTPRPRARSTHRPLEVLPWQCVCVDTLAKDARVLSAKVDVPVGGRPATWSTEGCLADWAGPYQARRGQLQEEVAVQLQGAYMSVCILIIINPRFGQLDTI
jgi:hypothetical protein